MRAVLRRQEVGGRIARSTEKAQGYRFAGWRLDQRRRELRNPSGEEVPLTKGEFALLVAFLEAPGRPLSREHLLQATRMHEHIFDRSIDVQVLRLHRKLEPDLTAPRGGRRILSGGRGRGDWASRAASHRPMPRASCHVPATGCPE
jgi:two-component system, OmpR family, response regulator